MFQYFFGEYKRSIYKGTTLKEGLKNIRKLPPKVWLMLLCFILCYAGMIITFCLGKRIISAIFILAIAVDTGALQLWDNRYLDETRDKRIEQYKKNKIHPLIDLLQDSRFSFYSAKKMDWLISCCEAELKAGENPLKGMPDSFFKWVFPFATLLLGTQINVLAPNSIAVILIIVFSAWAIAFLLKIPVSYLIDHLACPDKNALLFLKSELKYIQLLLDEAEKSATDSKSSQDDSEKAPEMVAQAGT